MTTHRRAWMLRAGVVVALVASALVAVPAAPAMATAPTVQITSLSSGSLTAGQRATMQFRVTNNNPAGGQVFGGNDDSFNINVSSTFGELTCQGSCDFTATIKRDGGSKDFTVDLVAGNVPAGQTKSGKVRITAQANNETGSTERNISVQGPDQSSTMVAEISGKVTDMSTGAAISGATVAISDSQNNRYSARTGSTGTYRFVSSASKPIAPGEIFIGALADNYEQVDNKRVTASAGQRLTNIRIPLKSTKAPSPTAAAAATEEVTADSTADPAEAAPTNAAAAPASNDSGSGSGSWLLIIVGGLLVALGVGAIVLLLVRRKENENAEDDDAAQGRRPGVAAGAGGYRGGEPTRVANRAGAGADATMVARPSLADAPTMMHNRPLVDEFPDPYGAPLPPPEPQGPQPPAYGGAQPGWGANGYGGAPTQTGYGPNQPAYGAGEAYGGPSGSGYGAAPSSGSGYGAAPSSGSGYGAAPSSGAGYGGPSAPGDAYGSPAGRPGDGYSGRDYGGPGGQQGQGYGAPQGGHADRYDEATGRYDPSGGYGEPADPYDTSYGQSAPKGAGYGPSADSGQQGYGGQAGGYEAQGGYGADGRGYGTPRAGSGYSGGQPGYEQRGGYDRVPEQRGGGYDAGAYEQGGYYDDQAGSQSRRGGAQQPTRSERRSLDWLDD